MKCFECGKKMKKVKGQYKYDASGLDDVILGGISIFNCDCGEEMPEIPNIEGLHKAIAYSIAKEYPRSLNGAMFRFLRKELNMKAKELASILGVSAITISRWENDKESIGVQSDKLIRMIYIQTLEEKCGTIFKDSVKSIAAIKASRKRLPINVDKKLWQEFCVA